MENSESRSPDVQRCRLKAELRRARLNAELTQEEVAAALDWSLSKIIRIENGAAGISTGDLEAILRYYKITDDKRVAEFLALAVASRERSWWSTYRDLIGVSAEAISAGVGWRRPRFAAGGCVEVAPSQRAVLVRGTVRPGGGTRIPGSGRRMFANLADNRLSA